MKKVYEILSWSHVTRVCVSHVKSIVCHMSQGCVVTCHNVVWSHVNSIVVTCQQHCVSHVKIIVCHMSKALCVTCHNGRVTECMDLRCRVTECMNGSSVHEWFLNNYEMVMDE